MVQEYEKLIQVWPSIATLLSPPTTDEEINHIDETCGLFDRSNPGE